MAVDERKQRILQHLKQSADGVHYISPKQTREKTPPTPPPTTPPPPIPQPTPKPSLVDNRKQRIMNHLKSSSGEFGDFSLTDKIRKKKVVDHIRKSLS